MRSRYSPDGERLASVTRGELIVSDVTPDGSPRLAGLVLDNDDPGVGRLHVSPDGSEVLAFTPDGAIQVVARDTGELRSIDGQLNGPPSYSAVPSADWEWVGSVDEETGRCHDPRH